MTLYTKKSFTVPASGKRQGECQHSWVSLLRGKWRCVPCGEVVDRVEVTLTGTYTVTQELIDRVNKLSTPVPPVIALTQALNTYCDEGE